MEQHFHILKLYSSILLESFHYSKYDKGWSYPAHKHYLYEFICCVSGSVEQWVNGEPFYLQTGDALIIKYGMYHQTKHLAEDTELFIFHFDMEVKEIQLIFQIMDNPLIRADEGHIGELTVSGWVKAFIAEFTSILVEDRASMALALEKQWARSILLLKMQTRVLEFICLLADYFLKETPLLANGKVTPVQINRAYELAHMLELFSGERLNINEAAARMGVHRSYLSNCFRQVYGTSPSEYAKRIKTRSAKQLLQHSAMTIEEIALQLQFSSAAHFSTFFKKNAGIAPLGYRNLSLKAHF